MDADFDFFEDQIEDDDWWLQPQNQNVIAPGVFNGPNIIARAQRPALFAQFGQPIATYYLRPGARQVYGIDWTAWLINYWRAVTQYAPGDTIRTWRASPFEYVCSFPGISGSEPPSWSAYSRFIQDGEVQWKPQQASDASLITQIASVVWTVRPLNAAATPNGFGIDLSQVLQNVALVAVNSSQSVPFSDYAIVCTMTTADDQEVVGEIRIKIR